jgi:hypothetical protein
VSHGNELQILAMTGVDQIHECAAREAEDVTQTLFAGLCSDPLCAGDERPPALCRRSELPNRSRMSVIIGVIDQ